MYLQQTLMIIIMHESWMYHTADISLIIVAQLHKLHNL